MQVSTLSDGPDPTQQTAPPKRRKRLRRVVLACLALTLIAGFVVTRPAVLARFLLPAAARALGGAVTAKRVSLDGLETLRIEDLSLRVEGWDGPAGEIATADNIRIRFSIWNWLRGDAPIQSVVVGRLALRIAERDNQPSQFSVLDLRPDLQSDEPSAGTTVAPSISIDDLAVENGVVTKDGYSKLGELRFRGTLKPSATAIPTAGNATATLATPLLSYAVELTGRPDAQGRIGITSIQGSYAPEARLLSLQLEDLTIEDAQPPIAPLAVRTWTRRLGLEGRVRLARLEYAPTTPPSAELDVEGVAMDLPIDALGDKAMEANWSGLRNGAMVPMKCLPRLTVRRGTLRLTGDRVELLDVEGEMGARDASAGIIAVPFRCGFTLDIPRAQLPTFAWETRDEWFTKAAGIAPFRMDFSIPSFSSPAIAAGAPDTLQLPLAAAKVIADFNIHQWTIDVATRFERAAPGPDGTAAPFRSSGTLDLTNCAGAFEEFPYPLEHVSGRIRFENDNLVVEDITARPKDAAPVVLAGRLDGIATGAEIDLTITCADALIDDRLFASFEEGPRTALKFLFDERANAQLAQAGLLPDSATLVTQRQQLARLPETESTQEERLRLKRSIDAGPFSLGGRCGFEVRVHSPAGFDMPIYVTGRVEVRDAGIVFARFPYPLRLKKGVFRLLDEAIEIDGDGLEAVTPAGGEFVVGGAVRIPRDGKGGRILDPDLTIRGKNDVIQPALIAAIPPASDEPLTGWPGTALAPGGALLKALGLRGSIAIDGHVFSKKSTDATGTTKTEEVYTFSIDFSQGVAAPDDDGRAWLDAQGLPWPPDFQLTDCSAHLEIDPDRVTFTDCTGKRDNGRIVAHGYTLLDSPESEINLEMHALPIERAFESYLSPNPVEARARFEKFKPTGSIDGAVRRVANKLSTEKGATTRGWLAPRTIEITLDSNRVRADRVAGNIVIDGSTYSADSLEYRLTQESLGGSTATKNDAPNAAPAAEKRWEDAGLLRISGPLSTRTTEPSNTPSLFDVQLTGGRFSSPLLREVLRAKSPALLEWMQGAHADGRFNAHYTSKNGPTQDGEAIEVDLVDLTLDVPEGRIALHFEPDSKLTATGEVVAWDVTAQLDVAAAPFDATASTTVETTTNTPSSPARGVVTLRGQIELGRGTSPSHLMGAIAIDAPRLTAGLRRFLPPPLDLGATSVDLVTDQRFFLDLPEVEATWIENASRGETASSPTGVQMYRLRGQTQLTDARFSAGTAITDFDGVMPLSFHYQPGTAQPIALHGVIQATSARAFDKSLTDIEATLDSTSDGNGLRVAAAGSVAFGRFDLQSTMDFTTKKFALQTRLAGADFTTLVASATTPPSTSTTQVPSASDGTLECAVTLNGDIGSTPESIATRRGFGKLAIRNAPLANAPVALRALQLTQLMLPLDASLDQANASFQIVGDDAQLETCELRSGMLRLVGNGTVDLPTFAVALRFFPRGTVPIFSDVVGGVMNQLFAIDVQGTLGSPITTVVPIPAIQNMPTPGTSNTAASQQPQQPLPQQPLRQQPLPQVSPSQPTPISESPRPPEPSQLKPSSFKS
jgi:hypothetical protein